MQVSASAQACALGSAVAAAVIAGGKAGGYDDFKTAQAAMTSIKDESYTPNPENHAVYNEIFEMYRQVHDAFGGVKQIDLGGVMKSLLTIKDRQRKLTG
jgi:L-ribulokinase